MVYARDKKLDTLVKRVTGKRHVDLIKSRKKSKNMRCHRGCASLVSPLPRLCSKSRVRTLYLTHTKTPPSGGALLCGPPGEIRTPDTQVRSLVLYPAELRAEARSLGFPLKKVKEMSEHDGKTLHTSVSGRPVKYRKILGESLKVISHQRA